MALPANLQGKVLRMSEMGRARFKPAHILPGGGIWANAHREGRDAIAHWNADNGAILKRFGLRIVEVHDLDVREPVRKRGEFEVRESRRVSLAAALPALATAFEARGSATLLPSDLTSDAKKEAVKDLKSAADMWATGAMTAAFRHIVESNQRFAINIVVGEGTRPKPGEGRNPTLYPGQLLAGHSHLGIPVEALADRGVSVVNGVVDPIDGTGKTVNGLPSAITSLVLVNDKLAQVPDGRFEKLIIPEAAADKGLDMNDSFKRIAEAIADSYKIPPKLVNAFMLDRAKCHPFVEFAKEIGINAVLDKDGDLMPGVTLNIQDGLMVNGQPLHAMIGNSGGAPEFLLSAIPAMWLGGEAFGQLVSDTMKKNGWERRFEYTDAELQAIRESGLETQRIYPISELVPQIRETDGVAAFGAITDNWHLPYHDATVLGKDFAQVDVLKIGASGAVLLRRFVFGLEQSVRETADLFRPILIRLAAVDDEDLRGELKRVLERPATAEGLRDEFGTAYPDIFTPTPEGKMKLIPEKVETLSKRDRKLLKELEKIVPDWFE